MSGASGIVGTVFPSHHLLQLKKKKTQKRLSLELAFELNERLIREALKAFYFKNMGIQLDLDYALHVSL